MERLTHQWANNFNSDSASQWIAFPIDDSAHSLDQCDPVSLVSHVLKSVEVTQSHFDSTVDLLITLEPNLLPLLRPSKFSFAGSSDSATIWVREGSNRPLLVTGAREILEEFVHPRAKHHKNSPSVTVKTLPEEQIVRHPRGLNGLLENADDFIATTESLQEKQLISLDGPHENCLSSHEIDFDWLTRQASVMGALARVVLPTTSPNFSLVDNDSAGFDEVDVIGVTTNRYRSVRELLRSIRSYWGWEVNICLVAQTPQTARWSALATKFKAEIVHVAKDTGLSASRNIAVDRTHRPIVFLVDDDFQIDDRSKLKEALTILAHRPEVSILGGNLLDVAHWRTPRSREVSQGFAMRLIPSRKSVRWLRLEDAPRNREFISGSAYIEECDIVDNFAAFKRQAVFDRGIRWNNRLKIGAEHQDFYIRVQRAGNIRVFRTNLLKVRNVRIQPPTFRKMRSRADLFFSAFFKDLGLDGFEIVGERERGIAQDGGSIHIPRDGRMLSYHDDFWDSQC